MWQRACQAVRFAWRRFDSRGGFLLERLPTPRIWALPLDPGQLRHELIGNLVFITLTSACFVAALGSGVPRFAAPSFAASSLTFLALML